MVEAEVTTACNRRCRHCYLRNVPPREMPIEMFKELLKEAADLGVKIFVITGGEPLLYSKYDELHDLIGSYIRNHNIFFYLQTNGDFVTEEKIKNFGAIQVGYDPLNYVREPVDFEKLQKINKPVFLFITIYKQLWEKIKNDVQWFEEHLEELKNMGFHVMFNTYIGGSKKDSLALTKEEYFDVVSLMYDFYERGLLRKPREPYSWMFEEKIRRTADTGVGGCSAGIAACIVDPMGTVFPCPFFRVAAGSLREQSFKDIWLNSPLFKALRFRDYSPCSRCRYVRVCGGCRARAYYSKRGVDPYCPLLSGTGQAYDKIFKIYDEMFRADWLYDILLKVIKEVLGGEKPASILEFGCGNGRFLKILKEELGGEVWGVDISKKMVEEAVKRTGGRIVLGDMRWIRLGRRFDLIVAAFDVFNHLEPEDVLRFLKNVKRHLSPGGVFVFDVNTEVKNPSVPVKRVGSDVVFNINVDEEEVSIVSHMYTPTDVKELLRSVGLEIIREVDIYHRVIFVARLPNVFLLNEWENGHREQR